MSFWLLISLIWLIVITVAFIYLYVKFQQFKQTELHDLVELFETYLEDIKAENQQLQEQLRQSTSNKIQPSNKLDQRTVDESYVPIGDMLYTDQTDVVDTTVDDQVELSTSFEANVLQLYHQGYSEENIARKLNSGKTEVALIINLYGEKR